MKQWRRLVSVAVLALSLGCLNGPSQTDIPKPPHLTYDLWLEIARLEGSKQCEDIRTYVIEEVHPYFESLEEMRD